MSDGPDTPQGQVADTPAVIDPIADVLGGQVAATPDPGTGQPNDEAGKGENPLGGMPLPPNWDQMNEVQQSAYKDSSTYWQNAFQGYVEDHKTENEKDKRDAGMFRQLTNSPSDRAALAESMGWTEMQVKQAESEVGTPAPVSALPESIMDMTPEQVNQMVETRASQLIEQKMTPMIQQYDADKRHAELRTQFNELSREFKDADRYINHMDQVLSSGRANNVRDAYMLVKLDEHSSRKANGAGMPAFPGTQSQAPIPPDQISAAASQTQSSNTGQPDTSGKSTYEIMQELAKSDPDNFGNLLNE